MAEPMNPLAGKAGPGKFSVREDLPPSKEYGERKQMQEIIQGAPTSTTGAAAEPVRRPMTQVTPLFAPTERPEEPISAGADFGPGVDSSALMMNRSMDTTEDRNRLISYLPALEVAAQSPTSSQAFRNYVRMLRAQLL
jgi:hypothetical protein